MFNAILHRSFAKTTTARLLAVALALLSMGSFSVRAQDFRFYFPFDRSVFRPELRGNARTLSQLDSVLTLRGVNNVDSILVVSYASPEGNFAYNMRLSQRRSESIHNVLLSHFPSFSSKMFVSHGGESWDWFRTSILNETRLSEASRLKVMSIVDSDASPDLKEVRLRVLPEYAILKTHFPVLRYSTVRILPDFPPRESMFPSLAPGAPLLGGAAFDASEALYPRPKTYVKTWRTIVALKTNLLYDLVTALNFEIEVPIADRWSIMAEDVFPWWETGNKWCFQMWEIGLEGRYWFRPWKVDGTEKLRGLFAGVYGMSSKYDFQLDRKLNYQGEYWSTGVTVGYAIPVGRRQWANFEFSVSAGYVNTDYRHYWPTETYDKLIRDKYKVGNVSYVGPTKAKISLVIPINVPNKKKEVRYE